MRDTPQHSYQILTKRPERLSYLVSTLIGDILPNVWLGTSIENAEVAHRSLQTAPAETLSVSYR